MKVLTVFLCAGLLVLNLGCGSLTPSQNPEDVVNAALISADQEDWGTVDALLTERLNRALQPGSLPTTWQTIGSDAEVIKQAIVGRTAHVWIRATQPIEQVSQSLQVDPATLRGWLSEPNPLDPGYVRNRERLAALTLSEDVISATSRFTLFRQANSWKIEFWGIEPLPDAALPPLPTSESEDPDQQEPDDSQSEDPSETLDTPNPDQAPEDETQEQESDQPTNDQPSDPEELESADPERDPEE